MVRSMSRAALTSIPAAASRANVDALAPATGCDRHTREQRQTLDQALEGVDPRNAAGLEELIGDVVLARERAGVRDRKLARGVRAAELVGDDRLAALGGRK